MRCPHCGFDNTEGRRFCKGCAKPLSAAAQTTPPVPPQPVPLRSNVTIPASTPSPDVHPLAIASLALSFLAFIVPLGIASVVMGHISRKVITGSGGRQKGTGLAFAGLIISYLQLAVVALIFVVAISLGYQANQKLGQDRYVRAALVERMLNGDPNHPSAAAMAQNDSNLRDALHLILARQEDYRKEHGNYACNLNYLEPDNRDDELAAHVRDSHYGVRLFCRRLNDKGYVDEYTVTGFPDPESNPPNAPVYCADETKSIRRYSDGASVISATQNHTDTCPDDGQAVE